MAVLVSGTGSNLQALLDDPVVGPWIALVVSDRKDAPALVKAEAAGVNAVFLEPGDRAGFDVRLRELLEAEGIEHVVNAGFMRILGATVVRPYEGRWLNIHPSLLPAFPGAHGVRDALAWGAKISGVTIHLVDEEVDHGPIVMQEAVPVLPDDDEATLHARIREVEHRLYPKAVRALVEGRLKVEGRIVHVLEERAE